LKRQRSLITYGGVWAAEAEPTNDHKECLKQPSLSRDDLRYHVEVHA